MRSVFQDNTGRPRGEGGSGEARQPYSKRPNMMRSLLPP